jgi:hypothetical protein
MRLAARPTTLAALALFAGAGFVALRERPPAYTAYGADTPVALIPTLTGEPEYCLTCHDGIEEISPSHPTEVLGCVRCHGGQPLALEATIAHSGLRGGGNPSSSDVVEPSCGGGDCHSGPSEKGLDHIHRSRLSLQATYAGAIAAVRQAFGAQEDSHARFAAEAVSDPDVTTSTGLPSLAAFLPPEASEPPQVRAFADRCLSCHLDAAPLDRPGYQRLSGCAACHALTNWEGTYTGNDPTIARGEPGHAAAHRLTTQIPYGQCDTCHNRGNYSLVDMAFHERPDSPSLSLAARVDAYYQPIAQFSACEYELDCIDCHPSAEAMGDGDLHSRMDEVRSVECRTCHGTSDQPPRTHVLTDPEDPALRAAHLNRASDLEVGDTVVVTSRGAALWNVRVLSDGTIQLISKVSGKTYTVPQVAGSACEQDPANQSASACHECHAIERP